MYKRVVNDYIECELKQGKTLDQIRKRLISVGYDKEDLDEILRTFEYREGDIRNREERLETTKTRLSVLLVIGLAVIIINAAFFFYYFSNIDYMQLRGIPTGLIIANATEEEPPPLEKDLNITNSSLEGTGSYKEIKEIELGYYS